MSCAESRSGSGVTVDGQQVDIWRFPDHPAGGHVRRSLRRDHHHRPSSRDRQHPRGQCRRVGADGGRAGAEGGVARLTVSVSAAGLALPTRIPGSAASPPCRVCRHHRPAGGTGGGLAALPLSADAARTSFPRKGPARNGVRIAAQPDLCRAVWKRGRDLLSAICRAPCLQNLRERSGRRQLVGGRKVIECEPANCVRFRAATGRHSSWQRSRQAGYASWKSQSVRASPHPAPRSQHAGRPRRDAPRARRTGARRARLAAAARVS